MPVSWRFDRGRNYIVAELTNPLDIEDIRVTVAKFVGSRDFPPDTPALWDARRFDFREMDRGFQERLVATQKLYPERGKARVAIVVADDLGFGMVRMYQAIAAELPQEFRVFRDIADAEQWLAGS